MKNTKEIELSEEVKNKLTEAIVLWANENLIGKPAILCTCLYYTLEEEIIKFNKEINAKFY